MAAGVITEMGIATGTHVRKILPPEGSIRPPMLVAEDGRVIQYPYAYMMIGDMGEIAEQLDRQRDSSVRTVFDQALRFSDGQVGVRVYQRRDQ